MATGQVASFDFAAGLGSIRGTDGVEYLFHCLEIADGTRNIALGTRVNFIPVMRFGRLEASQIEPN